MDLDLRNLISQMTLEEKAGLCSGLDFWHTKPVDRLGIPSIMLTDGPHGLRKQAATSDHLGLNQSLPATCFPPAVTTSFSFDRDLLREIGAAIGEEAVSEGIAVILGPAVNIKRSPLCGRNFEYVSEDPMLAGELSAAIIQGIQSKGVGTSIKHYACNNQETARLINDSIVDERTLREIYLAPFEIAVKKAQPRTIMCSYNKINGTYVCENERLLTDIPRKEWGFEGVFVTDWGAMDERVWALRSGLDLEMPYAGPYRDELIVNAVRSGELDESVLDRAVLRILQMIAKQTATPGDRQGYDIEEHDALARRVLCESAVLLKNEDVLPLPAPASIAVIGEFARTPRYQGAGSSKINPHKVISALDELDQRGIRYDYARGYDLKHQSDPVELTARAVEAALGKERVLVFAGLPDEYESEGFDREHIDLPQDQNELIAKLVAANPNVVVVLHAGSAVRMPWLDQVKGVLLLGLGGQCVGSATVDLLYGDVNPSGKLTETYPFELQDTPAFTQFGKRFTTEYRESIYVGYRYYEKAKKKVCFPFGFGLSYTTFEYRDMKLSATSIRDEEGLALSLKVRNCGERAGKEVVQVYVAPPASILFKPVKQLVEFGKVFLDAGEEKELTFTLGKRAFAFWNVNINDWHVESGTYRILVGSSSADIRCETDVEVTSSRPDVPVPDYRENAPMYYALPNRTLDIPLDQFAAVYGKPVPPSEPSRGTKFTLNSTLWDARKTLVGKYLMKMFKDKTMGALTAQAGTDESFIRMVEAMINNMPLRSFMMSGASYSLLEGILLLLNRKYLKGFRILRKEMKHLDVDLTG